MAVLLIATDLPAGSDLSETPLGVSLPAAGADIGWTADPAAADASATVMVDADTTLRPGSLDLIAEALAAHPGVEVFTADGVVGDELQLRGAWSPTRIADQPAELDLLVVRGRVGRAGLLDRIDRLFETDPARIGHLPAVLTHRAEFLGLDERAEIRATEQLESRRTLPEVDAVSVVIPTGGFVDDEGRAFVGAAIDAARRGGIAELEILLVVGDEFVGDPETFVADDVRLVRRPSGSWNFSAAVNLGILAARHDHVLILNDDVEAIDDGWLAHLAAHVRDPDVGVVGALLLFPDHTAQHAGMIIDDAVPLHCFAGQTLDELRASGGLAAREMAAVTGACLLARRADLLELGGLNEALPFNFNDVDLCMKMLRSGRRVVFAPRARLVHHEGASREPITHGWEWDRFVHRWGFVDDPWYHPAFVRPDDPDDRRRNADHLLPDTVPAPGALRTAVIRSAHHEARLRGHEPEPTPG